MTASKVQFRIVLVGFACLALSLAVLAAPLSAQNPSTSDGPGRAFSANPVLLLAGWVFAEYEQRISPSVTLGGGGSYYGYDDVHYTNFELKGRLYPSEHAMRGFSIAASLGVARLSWNDYGVFTPSSVPDVFGCGCVRKSVTSPAVGVELGYQWLLGRSRHTALNLGLGAKRFLASKTTLIGTDVVIPTFRFGVGYAF